MRSAQKMATYDKAKWHYEGDFPKDLPPYQGFVHIGLFLGWALDRGFEGELLREDYAEEVASYRAGKISATRVLEITDGVLDDQMLSEEANRFAEFYYDAHYLTDFYDLFPNLPSSYHVADTSENARLVSQRVNARYEAWKTEKK